MREECVNINEAAGSEGVTYDDTMYDTFKQWWKAYNVKPIPKGCLEPPAIGIVLKDKGAVWLYETAPVKVEADHIILNPSIRGSERKKIQSKLLDQAGATKLEN